MPNNKNATGQKKRKGKQRTTKQSVLKDSRHNARKANPNRAKHVTKDKAKGSKDIAPNELSKKQLHRLRNVLPRLESLPDTVKTAATAFAQSMLAANIILHHSKITQNLLSIKEHLPRSTHIKFKLTCIKSLSKTQLFQKLYTECSDKAFETRHYFRERILSKEKMEYEHNLHELRTKYITGLTQYFDIIIGTLRSTNQTIKAPFDDKIAAHLMTIEYLSHKFTSADEDEIWNW